MHWAVDVVGLQASWEVESPSHALSDTWSRSQIPTEIGLEFTITLPWHLVE